MMKRTLTAILSVLSVGSLLGLSIDSRAQAPCTTTSLKGTFGLSCQGTFGGEPAAEVGIATYDGKGNVSGRSTISVNGTITKDAAFSGTYTLQADCTGSASFLDGSQVALVLDDHRRELRSIATVEGTVYTCLKKKQ
jgi:hypothetical protein